MDKDSGDINPAVQVSSDSCEREQSNSDTSLSGSPSQSHGRRLTEIKPSVSSLHCLSFHDIRYEVTQHTKCFKSLPNKVILNSIRFVDKCRNRPVTSGQELPQPTPPPPPPTTTTICGQCAYRRNWLLSACAYSNSQQETMCLIKSMRLTASVRLIERTWALWAGPSTACVTKLMSKIVTLWRV